MNNLSNIVPIRRALLSVADKTGILEFAQHLVELGVELLSTGKTATTLRQAGLDVVDVSEFTGFPEIMDGRVKTLHPKIAAGILSRRDQDAEVMDQHDILPIDLVVANLYPFRQTIANIDHTLQQAIENIDIGGPTLIRAAAKNFAHVVVVTDPSDYTKVYQELTTKAGVDQILRFTLMQKAFAYTAEYDAAICAYFNKNQSTSEFPPQLHLCYSKKADLRYGENPHQSAALYVSELDYNEEQNGTIAHAKLLQGKALSLNNLADADAAWNCVRHISSHQETVACAIIKHANPCGVAFAASLSIAYQNAFRTDPISAFGGVIAVNQIINETVAEQILANGFVEVIIAPKYTATALSVFARKPNIRVLQTGWQKTETKIENNYDLKCINGGLLIQMQDTHILTTKDLRTVSKKIPTTEQVDDLLFAWHVAKQVKSNAVVYAEKQATLGIGAGQMSRVDSARIACWKAEQANLSLSNAVMASDAFFPFADSVETAAQAGVKAIIQPGGSIRDQEIIDMANNYGIVMVFTGIRVFRH